MWYTVHSPHIFLFYPFYRSSKNICITPNHLACIVAVHSARVDYLSVDRHKIGRRCAFGAEDCTAWDEGFLDLVRHPAVLKDVEALIGADCLVDSTSISIQWPGESLFGPHVDRPFVSEDNTKDSWPYSARASTAQPTEASKTGTGNGLGLPPMNYPISVQVLWLLDNFTTANGAFFYLPPNPHGLRGSAARNARPFPQTRQGIFPPTPCMLSLR